MESKQRQLILYIDPENEQASEDIDLFDTDDLFDPIGCTESVLQTSKTVKVNECAKADTGLILSCLRDQGVDMSTVLICRNNGIFGVDEENNDVAPRKDIPAKENLWDNWVVHNFTIIPSDKEHGMIAATRSAQGREDTRSELQVCIPSFANFARDQDAGAVLVDEFYWAGGSSTFILGLTDEAIKRVTSNRKFRDSHGRIHTRILQDESLAFADDIVWMLKQAVE